LTEQERLAGRLPSEWEYTLPTEAQWERACRARTETKFNFGDDESKLGDYAWFRDNAFKAGEPYAHRVGQKTANPWGLCDMHGNVWEWCRDIYTEKLPGGRDPEVKRAGKTGRSNQVIRGASWGDGAGYCRSAFRLRDSPGDRNGILGFRVALSAVQ
jgi:formylglycine-generating enzyme required for sulfatase activity